MTSIFKSLYLLKWCPIFDTSPLTQLSKFNNFLWVCWFLGKNLSNFVPPVWKLHNPYCHTFDTITNLNLSCDQNSLVVDGSNSTPIGNVTYEWTLNNILISILAIFPLLIVGIIDLLPAITSINQSLQTFVFSIILNYSFFLFFVTLALLGHLFLLVCIILVLPKIICGTRTRML